MSASPSDGPGEDALPLRGIKVVEFGQLIAAPLAALVLADLGADVVKVEPAEGDPFRRFGAGGSDEADGSAPFQAFNRYKRSVRLDLKSDDAREAAEHLIAASDVVIQNFRPGVMDRLGLGPAEVLAARPDIIYASLSGFGFSGPDAQRPGVDLVVQAESGLMQLTGEADGPPLRVGLPVVDITAGNILAQAILAALFGRSRTGRGQHVTLSLLDVALHLQSIQIAEHLVTGELPQRTGNSPAMAAPADVLRTADGHLAVTAYLPVQWRSFCRELGRPELADDVRFATNGDRITHRAELLAELEDAMRSATTEQWAQRLQRAGIVVGQVRNMAQVLAAPQVVQSAILVETTPPSGRVRRMARLPYRLGATAEPRPQPTPGIGQHTTEVLDELGLSTTTLPS